MQVPVFNETELQVVGEAPAFMAPPIPIFNYPIPSKEAYRSLFLDRKAVWQIVGSEQRLFTPRIIPDNIARATVFEAEPMPPALGGGKDMFGVEWEFIPKAGGSMVRPGKPLLTDANEWYDKVVWPDIDSWDWEKCAIANASYLSSDKYNFVMFFNGWYERLISFMDFEGAAIAMIDEDQKEAVKDLFDKLTDLYIRIFDKLLYYFPAIDGFNIHDDWGSQRETFFSPDTAHEMIVPYMRRVTEYLHARGRCCELHSCGMLKKQVPNIIAAGWDSWIPQAMNDTRLLYNLYGDKLIIAVIPDPVGLEMMPEEAQRAAARAFADEFCKPGKPSMMSIYSTGSLTNVFREELYKQSRINYSV